MRRTTMFQVRELVRLHRMGVSCHEVARLLGVSPNTERPYREAVQAAGLLDGPAQELPDEADLAAAVAAHLGSGAPAPQPSSVERCFPLIEDWLGNGARPTAIHDRLVREHDDYAGSLSAVKRACLRIGRRLGVQAKDVAITVETVPGHVAQVDFGYVGKLLDPKTMRKRKAWVFVMVLGHSRHSYCEICFDQKIDTWLGVHARAFEWFGGVPEVVVPDNLKSAVIRAAFSPDDTVSLNRSYRELARYFGFRIDPTPPYDPQKKGKVESVVKYVKNNFFQSYAATLDAEELQQRLLVWTKDTAGQRIHGTTHKRPLCVFEDVEQATLRPLPPVAYAPVVWKVVKVHSDTHVVFGGAMYSVPWRWVGQQAWVRAVGQSVQVYVGDTRVATHRRGVAGLRITLEEHLPEGRRDLRHRSRSYWQQRAEQVGPETGSFVREVFESDDVLDQLRKVQAIVMHLERFPAHRAEGTCRRASFYANYEYRAIKRILLDGLDSHSLPVTAVVTNDGAPPRYARNVQQMLELHMENTNEPN